MKYPSWCLGRDVVFQVATAGVVGLAAMTCGAWMTWPSKSISILRDDGVSDNEISWLVALADLGNVISPIPSSYLMDCFGRKTILLLAGLLYVLTNVLIFVANNIWFIYIARLFDGFAKGILFLLVPIYLTEIASVQIRGALSTMFISMLNLGLFFGYLLGWLLSYNGLIVAYAIILFLFIITFFFVPESPYYLLMKKKEKQALQALAKFRQLNKDSEFLLQEYDVLKSTVSGDMANKNSFWDAIVTKTNRRAFLIISMLAIFQRTSGISPTLAYTTVILPKTGGGASSDVYMVIFSFSLFASANLSGPLIDNFGRKKLLICSSFGTAVVQGMAGTFFLLQKSGYDVESWNCVPYACLVIFGITYSLGLSSIPSTMVGELFPMNVKSYAGSISSVILAATSFFINKLFFLCPVSYMYFFFSFASIVSTAFSEFCLIETKGKTFSQIQEELRILTGEDI